MFSLFSVRFVAARFIPSTARPILSRALFSSHLQTRSFLTTPRLLDLKEPKPKSATDKPRSKPKAATDKSKPKSKSATDKPAAKRKLAAKKKPVPKKKKTKKAPVKKKLAAAKKPKKPLKIKIPLSIRRPSLRGPTAYVLYFSDFNASLPRVASVPEMNQRMAMIGPQWRALSDAEKQPYVEKAARLTAERREERAKWFKTTDRAIVKEMNKRRKARGMMRMVAPKEPSLVKRAPGSFIIFSGDFRKTPEALAVTHYQDVLKRAAERWNAMSAEEKQPYIDKNAELRAAWRAEQEKA